jgi:hypothetical protein
MVPMATAIARKMEEPIIARLLELFFISFYIKVAIHMPD